MKSFTRPTDDRAEKQLISLVSLYPDFYRSAAHLGRDSFDLVSGREAWDKIKAAIESGSAPDPSDYMEFHDTVYPVAPIEGVAAELARRVAQAAHARALIDHCSLVAQAAFAGDTAKADALAADPPRLDVVSSTAVEIAEGASRLFDAIGRGNISTSRATRIDALDRALDGSLEEGTSTILMARPAMGKTAALVQAADLMSESGLVVIFFSKEMGMDYVTRRMACRRVGVSIKDFKKGTLTEEKNESVSRECIRIMETRPTLLVDESSSQTTDGARAVCESAIRKYGRVDVVMADHAKLFADTADNETHRLGKISWAFKRIARDLKTRVILAAQLNRDVEKQGDKRPDLKDLRDSGEIEENADNVIGLYRERYYNPAALRNGQPDMTAEFISRKVRDGERNLRALAVYLEQSMSFERMMP